MKRKEKIFVEGKQLELQEKLDNALERIKELETELYFVTRNKKLEKCVRCNRNDGTCGCASLNEDCCGVKKEK